MKKVLSFALLLLGTIYLIGCDLILKKEYKVQFFNEDTLIKEETYKEGSLINEPSIDEIEGYDIKGWYKDLEDESSKWDFNTNILESHLILHVKFILNESYLDISDININDSILSFISKDDATYNLTIADYEVILNDSLIDLKELNEYLLNTSLIKITPILEGYIGITKEIKIKYTPNHETELLTMDFEDFSKSGYALSEITYNSYKFNSSESLIQAGQDNDNKNGTRSIRFRKDGNFEFILPVENFYKLNFMFGEYLANGEKSSNLDLLYKYNLEDEWILFNTYNSTKEFINYELSNKEILDFKEDSDIYFKFQKDSIDARVNIDDIYITSYVEDMYTLLEDSKVELAPYYKSVEGLEGKELVEELNFIISTNTKDIRYSDIKQVLEFSDVSLDNSNLVVGIYNRELYKANWGSKSQWHREHVWPNSKLGMERVKESGVNQGSDPHNLRAIYPSINSTRSNRYYDSKLDELNQLGHTNGKEAFYPGDLDVGDVSRILMYMAIRYIDEGLILTNHTKLLTKGNYTKDTAYMGKLNLLLDWHNLDKVDDFEVNRNNVIYEYQGNRNPFIDQPELFELVFNYFNELDEARNVTKLLMIDTNLNYYELRRFRKLSI